MLAQTGIAWALSTAGPQIGDFPFPVSEPGQWGHGASCCAAVLSPGSPKPAQLRTWLHSCCSGSCGGAVSVGRCPQSNPLETGLYFYGLED